MSIDGDVGGSLEAATRCNNAFDEGIVALGAACEAGRWEEVEAIRERLLAAVDGYVDHYAAACRRLEAERIGR